MFFFCISRRRPPRSTRTATRFPYTTLSRSTVSELRERFGFSQVRLLNDYAALALGLENLAEGDRLRIGPARPTASGALAVLGPGSGLDRKSTRLHSSH